MSNRDGQSLFDQAGGEIVLRAVLRDFYDVAFADVMIGFFFARADKERLIDKEYELAAAQLGGPVTYTGQGIAKAHRAHRINGGQFMRRIQLLKESMVRHGVPRHVMEAWIEHNMALRSQVTRQEPGVCD